jgi:hypothetical protein
MYPQWAYLFLLCTQNKLHFLCLFKIRRHFTIPISKAFLRKPSIHISPRCSYMRWAGLVGGAPCHSWEKRGHKIYRYSAITQASQWQAGAGSDRLWYGQGLPVASITLCQAVASGGAQQQAAVHCTKQWPNAARLDSAKEVRGSVMP